MKFTIHSLIKDINIKKIKIIHLSLFLVFSVGFITVIPNTIAYGSLAERRILFISSYTESFDTLPDQISGIQTTLKPHDINVDIEYMDSKRFDSLDSRKFFYQWLEYKLTKLPAYDVIIVGDDDALQFAMDYQEQLFNKTPIIFLGINDLSRANLAGKDPYITGVIEELPLVETIEIAHQFNPQATKVVAILDDTITGIGDRNQFYQAQANFTNLSFEEINASKYTVDEMKDLLKGISNDTILLYLNMYQDKTETNLTINEAVELIREHTSVPVYRANVGGVGEGLIGGKMVSYFEQGRIAATLALQVLEGVPVSSIDIVTESPSNYFFDYQQINKYKIDKDLIPKDAIIINRHPSFYEQNRSFVNTVLAIIVILLCFILIVIIDNIKRRKIEKALQESHEELEAAYEELVASEEELGIQYKKIQEHTTEITILNQKYEIAISGTNSAVWEIDLKNRTLYLSQEFSLISDKKVNPSEDFQVVLDELFYSEDKKLLLDEYKLYEMRKKDLLSLQLPIKSSGKTKKWMLIRGKGVTDPNGKLIKLSGIAMDISKMKEQEAYIDYLAYHDTMTGLPNRTSFMDKIQAEIAREKHGAILLLDLDNFKEVNDTMGHTFGDLLLQRIATRLLTLVNNEVFVSRFGGDEFLILIRGEDKSGFLDQFLSKISQLFKQPFIINEIETFIRFSMGIAKYPKDSNDIEQLIMYADTAMYKVKHSGKNNYMFFHDQLILELKEKIETENIILHALKNDGFTLVYQPQVETKTGKIVGFEALIRLKENQMSPAQFIPIAEENGHIIDIGRWVTRKAINQIARWKTMGFALKPISINLSSNQIKDETYLVFLENTLNENGVDAKFLEIEITESILLKKSKNTLEFLNKMKDLGVRISLDDFGTGYSSLNYLSFLPIEKVKLDKSLSDKFLKLDKIKIMDNIISLAHSLDLEITAEGIEEVEQYRQLKVVGCDYIQGYLFSKPLNVEEIEKIYDHNLLEKITSQE